MIEVRDYQQELLGRVDEALARRDAKVMMQLPTGGGKTHIAGALLNRWLVDGRKAVWLTHRRELAKQTERMLSQGGVPAAANILWTPSADAPVITNGVVILMAQTVSRRNADRSVWDRYDASDLMIIDEAHHATAEGWARAMEQWPGPVLGMTATPWRLSEREGFDHLFKNLLCGPQVADLQSGKWLCKARVISPPEEEQIQGGEVAGTGDYNESGIERANEGRNILTAGALKFWEENACNRQTVVYAVSVGHAQNLVELFNDAGISAACMLGDTPDEERADIIARFQQGTLKALVNVAVATEGFDLPDAGCVMLTRPTMSLSLYLQMVGRGLRPKEDGSDCLVLDLAGNAPRHGLPEEYREWSLKPRARTRSSGESPVVHCPDCMGLSPAASHQCDHCGKSFGELCGRCGAWRAWKMWRTFCFVDHEPVCDRCHYDAHIEANLSVTKELEEASMPQPDDELSPNRDPFLKNLIQDEIRRSAAVHGQRMDELKRDIKTRESEVDDDNRLEERFQRHLDGLPPSEQPRTKLERWRQFPEWEKGFQQELEDWKKEFDELVAQPIDKGLVLNKVRDRLMGLFEAEAREAGLVADDSSEESVHEVSSQYLPDSPTTGPGEWVTFADLDQWHKSTGSKDWSIKPQRVRFPGEKEKAIKDVWISLILETAEWSIRRGLLTTESGVGLHFGNRKNNKRYLIHTSPDHPNGRNFKSPKKLTNGLYLDSKLPAGQIASACGSLVAKFDQDPAKFEVFLSK